jgi:hypothetical protein
MISTTSRKDVTAIDYLQDLQVCAKCIWLQLQCIKRKETRENSCSECCSTLPPTLALFNWWKDFNFIRSRECVAFVMLFKIGMSRNLCELHVKVSARCVAWVYENRYYYDKKIHVVIIKSIMCDSLIIELILILLAVALWYYFVDDWNKHLSNVS